MVTRASIAWQTPVELVKINTVGIGDIAAVAGRRDRRGRRGRCVREKPGRIKGGNSIAACGDYRSACTVFGGGGWRAVMVQNGEIELSLCC